MKGLPRWFWWVTIASLVVASLPYLFAVAIQPEGTLYLGVHSNYDDHAVYAAWTKQAQEGHVFFENRFTTDAQPGRTIHLYFLAAGWLAKAVGIPVALHIFRFAFGFLALLALYRLIEKGVEDERSRALAFVLAILTTGGGFLVWRNYGFDGPVDIWQPEVFTFASLMQNGLFCAALWLILLVWKSILEAKDSWRPVLTGALALLALTNIHTYDTLQIAIVSAGFLAAMVGAKSFTKTWLIRSLVIASGAVPSIIWFVYIRSIDPVFASRADTVTISAPVFMVILGLFPALLAAGYGLSKHGQARAVIAGGALLVFLGIAQSTTGYRMDMIWASPLAWAALALIAIAICWSYKPKSPFYGLVFAWILLGFAALYYPGLFQRKLAMALAIPVGIGAGLAVADLFKSRSLKLVAAISALVLGASSIMWFARESSMPTRNLSNTTMHRIYWPAEVREFLQFFSKNAQANDAVIAMPGIAIPDDFENPREYSLAIPDLNAVMSGWGGVKSYVGHWSETPNYLERRKRVMSDLYSPDATYETAYTLLNEAHVNYVIAPTTEIAAQAGVPPRDFYLALGEVVYEGDEFVLVRFWPSP